MKPAKGIPLSFFLPEWLRLPVLRFDTAKEMRVLFPVWLLSLAGVVVVPALFDDTGRMVGQFLYFFGAATMGALSVGHEFASRTLSLLLVQPVSRESLLRTKFTVLTAALLSLGVTAVFTTLKPLEVFGEFDFYRRADGRMALVMAVLPVLSGLLVAPWLTLVCRSALAGTVFTLAMPVLFWCVGQILAIAWFGPNQLNLADTEAFTLSVLSLGLVLHWVAGGFLGWRTFMRLQAIEGPAPALRLPGWRPWRPQPAAVTAGTLRRQNVVWLLHKKELRLHSVVFIVAGLYVLAWATVWAIRQLIPEFRSDFFDLAPFVYMALVPVLTGGVASAEERELGTLGWQTLLPQANSRQWLAKIEMVFALTIVLGVALPFGLGLMGSPGNFSGTDSGWRWLGAIAACTSAELFLASLSLWVSSLCATGLRAVLVSLVLGFACLLGLNFLLSEVLPRLLGSPETILDRIRSREVLGAEWLALSLGLAGFLGWIGLFLGFGRRNHFSAEPGPTRRWRQVAVQVAFFLIWVVGVHLVCEIAATAREARQAEEQARTAAEEQRMATRRSATTPAAAPTGSPARAEGTPTMDVRMLMRYGLMPRGAAAPTNPPATVRFMRRMGSVPSVGAPTPSATTLTPEQELFRALRNYLAARKAQGIAAPATVSAKRLAEEGYLSAHNAAALKDVELEIPATPEQTKPEPVLARWRLTNGTEVLLLGDGSTQSRVKADPAR